jgi:hypothetical protein
MHESRRSILRSLAVAAATLLSNPVVHAVAQEVTIAPRLQDGDEFQLALIRTRENSAQPQQNVRSTTLVNVRVLSVTPDGMLLEWAPGEATFDNPAFAQNPLVAAAVRAVRDMRFRLTLNADGELTGLANRDEVLPKLQSVVNALLQPLSARLPPEQRQAMLRAAGQVLSPDVLAAGATREAGIYFGLNGVTISGPDTVEVDIEQSSPFGAGTIPASFGVRLESATSAAATLSTVTTYDPAALSRMMQSLVKEMGIVIPPDQLAKMPPLDISDTGRYVFSRDVGLMTEVIVTRRALAGAVQRLDGWEIRLLQPPRR